MAYVRCHTATSASHPWGGHLRLHYYWPIKIFFFPGHWPIKNACLGLPGLLRKTYVFWPLRITAFVCFFLQGFLFRGSYDDWPTQAGQGYEKRFFILLDWPFLFRSLFQSTWNVEGQMLVRAAQQRFSVHMPVLLPLPQPRYVFEISSVGFLKCVDVEGPRPVSSFSAYECANIERFNSTHTQTDQTESR